MSDKPVNEIRMQQQDYQSCTSLSSERNFSHHSEPNVIKQITVLSCCNSDSVDIVTIFYFN